MEQRKVNMSRWQSSGPLGSRYFVHLPAPHSRCDGVDGHVYKTEIAWTDSKQFAAQTVLVPGFGSCLRILVISKEGSRLPAGLLFFRLGLMQRAQINSGNIYVATIAAASIPN